MAHSTPPAPQAHIVRALLEAVALQVYDCVAAMRRDCRQAHFELHFKGLRVDGGMTQNNLLLQLQARLISFPPLSLFFDSNDSLTVSELSNKKEGFQRIGISGNILSQ